MILRALSLHGIQQKNILPGIVITLGLMQVLRKGSFFLRGLFFFKICVIFFIFINFDYGVDVMWSIW